MAEKMPRGCLKNLLCSSREEQVERCRKAGKASGEKRRLQRSLGDMLKQMLKEKPRGSNKTYMELMNEALLAQAYKGNVKAFSVVRDTIGEKPGTNIEHSGSVAMDIVWNDGEDGEA